MKEPLDITSPPCPNCGVEAICVDGVCGWCGVGLPKEWGACGWHQRASPRMAHPHAIKGSRTIGRRRTGVLPPSDANIYVKK